MYIDYEIDSEIGVCPKCKGEDLEIGDGYLIDDFMGSYWSIPYTCKSCGCKGKEIHALSFVGMSIDD